METTLDSRIEIGAPPAHRAISGFWRRLLAIVLDGLILGIVGFVSGLFFFNFYAQLGGWGRLIGLGVDSIYFGILNSAIGKGQTIGKRMIPHQKDEWISVDDLCLIAKIYAVSAMEFLKGVD